MGPVAPTQVRVRNPLFEIDPDPRVAAGIEGAARRGTDLPDAALQGPAGVQMQAAVNVEKPAREIQPGLVEGVPAFTLDRMIEGVVWGVSVAVPALGVLRLGAGRLPNHRHEPAEAGAVVFSEHVV